MDLVEKYSELFGLRRELSDHVNSAKATTTDYRRRIAACEREIGLNAAGFDQTKIDLAKTIIEAGDYASGGDERQSCVDDAIRQFVLGKPAHSYLNLWTRYFGTKNYDRWIGQREDHQYGYCPKHGSTVFRIGLKPEVRAFPQSELTPEQVESCVYYLTHLACIQEIEKSAVKDAAE